MAGTLQLEATFIIAGRGLVLVGQITGGTLQVGGRVTLPDGRGGDRTERITGVEFSDGRDQQGNWRSAIGLLVGELPNDDIPNVRAQLIPGLTLPVEDPEPGSFGAPR